MSLCCTQGLLNGREMFLQDNFVALDDANAGDDEEYKREDDEEQRINDMFEQVCACVCCLLQQDACMPACWQ